jgi:hypothetical protein
MSETPSNAVFVIAALSVILFSLVGVGVMTGVIPGSLSNPGNAKAVLKNARASAASSAPAQQACAECGRVEIVSLVESPKLSGAPAAGSEIAYRPKPIPPQRYEVLVRLPDGTARKFSYETRPEFRVGDTVKIIDGNLTAN